MNNKFVKGLALTLAATLAFTAVPATANAAVKKQPTKATKITFSPTKATVDNGKSKSVKIKLNKAATGKVTIKLKSSNSKIAKLNKSSVVVKKGKKVSGAFKVTGKTAGKSAKVTAYFYNKSGKKISKTFKLTVNKEAEKEVAVTGVTLDNTTPKVGDTITATVEPSNATNVAYAWYTGSAKDGEFTLLEGETGSSLKVTADMAGKYIKVQVAGDNESVATAVTDKAVEADAEAELAITAKQIGASKFEITSNKAIASTDKITVTRGSSERTFTAVYSEDGLTTVLTMDAAIGNAEYTIKVQPTDTTKAAATTKVTGAPATLESIDFKGDNLILTDSSYASATVKIFGYNSWGEEVKLSTLTPYASKGTKVEYTPSTNSITVTTAATAPFVTGEQVTVTAVYQEGTVVKQVSKALTISAASTVAELTFGELQTSNTALKDARVTLENMDGGTYYKTVVAKDQYGNTLSAKELNAAYNPGAGKTATFYMTPSQKAGSYVYITGFDTDAKGNVIAKYDLGALNMPGKQVFTFTGVGGVQSTDEIEVVDNEYVDKLSVTVPEIYQGAEAELTITGTNQWGEAVDLYNFVTKSDTVTGTPTGKDFYFSDLNHLTQGVSTITVPNNVKLRVDKNSSKKTVAFYVTYTTPVTATTQANLIVKPANASNTTNVTLSVQVAGKPAEIKASDATLKSGATYNFAKNLVFLDTYGASITNLGDYTTGTSYPAFTSKTGITAGTGTGTLSTSKTYYLYTIYDETAKSLVTKTDTVVAPTATTKYTVTLWKYVGAGTFSAPGTLTINNGTGGTDTVTQLDQKTITLTVATTNYKKFTASVPAAQALLYSGSSSTDYAKLEVKATDASGNTVTLDDSEYTVTVDKNAVVGAGNKITKNDGRTAGTTTSVDSGDITASVFYGGQEVATALIPYSDADPEAKTSVWKKTNAAGVTVDATSDITLNTTGASNKYTLYKKDGATLATDNTTASADAGVMSLTDGTNTYKLSIVDQYALTVVSSFTKDGKALAIGETKATNGAYKVSAGNVSYSFTATAGDDDAVPVATSITTSYNATTKKLTVNVYGIQNSGYVVLSSTTATSGATTGNIFTSTADAKISGLGTANTADSDTTTAAAGDFLVYTKPASDTTKENITMEVEVASSPAGLYPIWVDHTTTSKTVVGARLAAAVATSLSASTATISTDGGTATVDVLDQYGFKVDPGTPTYTFALVGTPTSGTGTTNPSASEASGTITITAGGDSNSNGVFDMVVDFDGSGTGTATGTCRVTISGQTP